MTESGYNIIYKSLTNLKKILNERESYFSIYIYKVKRLYYDAKFILGYGMQLVMS